MSLRDYLNKKPMVAAGFTGVAIVFVIIMMWGGTSGEPEAAFPKRFFTTDDGKTHFADTIDKIPPFTMPDGKLAYRAHVVQCGKGEPFVSYVEKYSESEKKRLEGLFSDRKTRAQAIESIMGGQDFPLVKKPSTGDKGWVDPKSGEQYDAVILRPCADGGTPQPVSPQK